MERLTHERVNGIKTGYWSAATKEVLVQKLAAYLGFAAIIAVNPEIDISDLERVRG